MKKFAVVCIIAAIIFGLLTFLFQRNYFNSMEEFTSSYVIDSLPVERMYNNRGDLIINDTLLVYPYARLKDSQPNWLYKRVTPIIKGKEYNPTILLHDVKVPFIIMKKIKNPFFYVIKNRDTIKFKLDI